MHLATLLLGAAIIAMTSAVAVGLIELAKTEQEQEEEPKLSHYTPDGLLCELELRMMEGEL